MATSLVLHGAGAAFALLVLPHVLSSSAGRAEDAPVVLELSVQGTLPAAQEQSPPVARAPAHAVHRPPAPMRAAMGPSATPPTLPAPQADLSAPDPDAVPVADTHAPPRAVARFALSAGSIAGRSDAPAGASQGEISGQDLPGSSGDGEAAGPLPETVVDAPARLASTAPLVYPEAARRAEIELDLPLEIVVSRQGRVLTATVLAHPGYGLEQAAQAAVRSYVFVPARRGGHEVAVKMRWTMQFRLR